MSCFIPVHLPESPKCTCNFCLADRIFTLEEKLKLFEADVAKFVYEKYSYQI